MKETSVVFTLLTKVNELNQKYKSLSVSTGENFNIFRILKLERKEVRTHSAFMSELLNTKGSHDQGDTFLRSFLDQQKEKFERHSAFLERLSDFNLKNAEASEEKYIGKCNKNRTKGGFIDILMNDKHGHRIIIENKIDAYDQSNQLIRYHNAYPNAPLFYLTLDGKQPSDNSKGDLVEYNNYVCISYKDDIKTWLETCQLQAVSHPMLRETISQYINLINLLTEQTMDDKFKNEIVELISKNAQFVHAAIKIEEILPEIHINIINKYVETLVRGLGKEWQSETKGIFGKKESELWLFKNDMPFMFVLTFYKDEVNIQFGIYRRDNKPNKDSALRKSISKKLEVLNIGSQIKNSDWIWVCNYDEWEYTSWEEVIDGKMTAMTLETINTIVAILDGVTL